MQQLFLVRHAATEHNERQLLVGSSDVAADTTALEEIEQTDTLLTRYDIATWYCSPMLRTRQTADRLQMMQARLGPPLVDDRLREIDFGRWELQSFSEVAAKEPDLVAGWTGQKTFTFPEGEAVADFTLRVQDMLHTIYQQLGNCLLVTHGGVIRTMICLALGIPVENYLLFKVAPGSLTHLEIHQSGGVLVGLNL
jgi:broad specificity phosphatase PhoE